MSNDSTRQPFLLITNGRDRSAVRTAAFHMRIDLSHDSFSGCFYSAPLTFSVGIQHVRPSIHERQFTAHRCTAKSNRLRLPHQFMRRVRRFALRFDRWCAIIRDHPMWSVPISCICCVIFVLSKSGSSGRASADLNAPLLHRPIHMMLY